MNEKVSYSDRSIVESLRRIGYRATPQRIAICRFVICSRDHPTAKRIYKEVKAQYPTISLATVYKTVEILRKLNMVKQLPIIGGDTRFDSNMKAHVNLVCMQCGNIRDLDSQIVQDMIRKISRAARFNVTGQFALYGICHRCDIRKEA
jgi:Fur family peroxide stress response transcriptional regulator